MRWMLEKHQSDARLVSVNIGLLRDVALSTVSVNGAIAIAILAG